MRLKWPTGHTGLPKENGFRWRSCLHRQVLKSGLRAHFLVQANISFPLTHKKKRFCSSVLFCVSSFGHRGQCCEVFLRRESRLLALGTLQCLQCTGVFCFDLSLLNDYVWLAQSCWQKHGQPGCNLIEISDLFCTSKKGEEKHLLTSLSSLYSQDLWCQENELQLSKKSNKRFMPKSLTSLWQFDWIWIGKIPFFPLWPVFGQMTCSQSSEKWSEITANNWFAVSVLCPSVVSSCGNC